MAGKLWNIIYQLWAAWNECLHETDTSNEFKGLDALCFSITLELRRGVRTLPNNLYLHYFQYTEEEIMGLDVDDKKAWFLLIRSARELHLDAPVDEFTCNDLLREWIGLSPMTMEWITDLIELNSSWSKQDFEGAGV